MGVDVKLIKELRETTGAGMMDCKKALEATDGNVDAAKDWLREKGITTIAKKEARIAAEGKTLVKICEKCGRAVILEVNCETDFVSNGEAFGNLVEQVAGIILDKDLKTVEEATEATKELFIDATIKMGEKLALRRFVIVELKDGEAFGSYSHMNGKINVLLVLNKSDEEVAKGLAMHIAANNPLYIDSTSIPADVIEHENEIQLEAAKNDPKLQDKNPDMLKNIIRGKVAKFLSESTLSEQVYLLDGEKKVGQFLKEKGLVVKQFIRYQVGEGIAKREDDFAKEVMEAAK
ncbi:MAG TPA: translation elongation factor Ts [Bacilli bacterium]|nr:translation elongation factor Ts [Bacilli bacterium]